MSAASSRRRRRGKASGAPPAGSLRALAERLCIGDDLPHLLEAVTHRSFVNEHRGTRDNQRLELLGDAVLGLLVIELLMARMPEANEGQLTVLRSQLVNTEALAVWARSVELGAALRLGRGAEAQGWRDGAAVLADAAEALLAAVYLDRGMAEARALVERMVAEPLERLGGGAAVQDAKSELQEQVQTERGASPTYRVVSTEGPPHSRFFVVVVEVDGQVLAEGRGRSTKIAEQAAARAAIAGRAGLCPEPAPAIAPPPELRDGEPRS
jgi:ribonuclease III